MIKLYAIENVKRMYPKGTQIELISTDDPYTELVPGDRGKVTKIDATGTLFVSWDKGSFLGLVLGIDNYKKCSQ